MKYLVKFSGQAMKPLESPTINSALEAAFVMLSGANVPSMKSVEIYAVADTAKGDGLDEPLGIWQISRTYGTK